MAVEYQDDPDLLSDILSALSKRIQSGMNLHRSKLLGNVPKDRDDFDPYMLLNKLEGGSKVIVKNSKKDLPSNWWKLDLGQQDIGIAFDIRTKICKGALDPLFPSIY